MAKTAVFEAMMGSNLYCMSIIMCFLAHLAIGHMSFYHQVSFVVRCRQNCTNEGPRINGVRYLWVLSLT
jgi:hypothetical protein